MNALYDEWFGNKHYWFTNDYKIDIYLCDKYFRYINETYLIYENYINGAEY